MFDFTHQTDMFYLQITLQEKIDYCFVNHEKNRFLQLIIQIYLKSNTSNV